MCGVDWRRRGKKGVWGGDVYIVFKQTYYFVDGWMDTYKQQVKKRVNVYY